MLPSHPWSLFAMLCMRTYSDASSDSFLLLDCHRECALIHRQNQTQMTVFNFSFIILQLSCPYSPDSMQHPLQIIPKIQMAGPPKEGPFSQLTDAHRENVPRFSPPDRSNGSHRFTALNPLGPPFFIKYNSPIQPLRSVSELKKADIDKVG